MMSFLFSVFTVICIVMKTEGFYDRLKAVPAIENVEGFYLHVRTRNKKSYESEPEVITSPRIKNRICRNIVSSALAQRMIHMKHVQVSTWFSPHYWLTRFSGDEDLLTMFHDEEDTTLKTPFQFPNKRRTIYIRSTKKDEPENAFLCLGIYPDSSFYAWCHVSEEYNINIFADEPRVPGRFVFIPNAARQMEVHFVAAEPAHVVEDRLEKLEVLYVDSRESIVGRREEPLCTLDKNKFTQICSSILNSSYFDAMAIRSSVPERIACKKEKLSFVNREFAYTRSAQEEFMVNCNTVVENKRTKKTFGVFVSRGNDRDNFFVYYFNDKNFYLLNLSTNIFQYYMHDS